MIINEILQWLAIIYAIWAMHQLGKAIQSLIRSIARLAKIEEEELIHKNNEKIN